MNNIQNNFNKPLLKTPHNFTNQIGYDIDVKFKKELISFIYNHVNFKFVRSLLMKTEEHAQQLKQQHFITPNFQGYNYMLIFKMLSDNVMNIYFVNRMDLKYDVNDIDINNTKIYKINIKNVDIDLKNFNDTIINGKIIFKKEKKIFLINDIYLYKGQRFITYKINDKLSIIDKELDLIIKYFDDSFTIKLIKLYKNEDISDLVYNKIKQSEFKINGLMFLPIRSGKTLIYINENEFNEIKNTNNNNMQNNETNNNVLNVHISKCENINKQQLLIQKTQIIDVYEVYSLDKNVRYGICAIPNMKLSRYMREYFKKNAQLINECEYNEKFSKWIPIIKID